MSNVYETARGRLRDTLAALRAHARVLEGIALTMQQGGGWRPETVNNAAREAVNVALVVLRVKDALALLDTDDR